MRVLLVTWTDQLLEKLSILNPELEFCAIVVDEVEPAKEILKRVGLPASLLYPLYELKECVRDFYYDYVLCLDNQWKNDFLKAVQKHEVPKNKIINFRPIGYEDFFVERSIRYFKEHAAEFDMFATGMSYVEQGLDVTRFKRKLFNFGRTSQDLYYNFQVAKRVILYGGGHNRFRYALIGLAHCTFHYDLSSTPNSQALLLSYLVAFNDLHNFHLSADAYREFFRNEYLATKLPLEPFDVNSPHYAKGLLHFMTPEDRLNARKNIDTWSERYFPVIRAENIKILDDYLTLCEENHIRPIMFLPPMIEGYLKYFSRQKLDEFHYLVRQACKKHPSAIFIDGWKIQGFTDADFGDVEHLNIQGAAKFSTFLNSVIEQLDRI